MIKEKPVKSKVEIDLSGTDGNKFELMGCARRWDKQLGYTPKETTEFINQLMYGDYNNLVNLMEERFGSFVTFYK